MKIGLDVGVLLVEEHWKATLNVDKSAVLLAEKSAGAAGLLARECALSMVYSCVPTRMHQLHSKKYV